MGWRDWFDQRGEGRSGPAIEYECFLDALEDAKKYNRTVAESYEHYGFETDPLKILARYTKFELQHAWLKAPVSGSTILKCNPSFLAHLWCAMVVRHYTVLADYAEFSHLDLTPEQVPRLFRQVYLFYDFLWGANLLLTRINETRVIGENQTQEYIKAFRIEALETLPQQHLPFACTEGLTIFEHGDENKEDWDFYRHGKLGKPCYEKDFAKVRSHLDIPNDWSPLELTAKLHFRTCQVLDLSHKLSLMEMDQWWKLQSKLADQHINKVMTKVIPIP